MLFLLFLGLMVVVGLIVIPLLLVGLVLKLVIGIALLPLRLAGFAIRVVLGLAAGVVALLVAILLAGGLLLIPLLPVIALVACFWMVFRLTRRGPATHLATD